MTVTEKSPSPAETGEVDDRLIEMAERIVEGRPLGDIFGLDDNALTALLRQAHSFYVAEKFEEAEVLVRGVLALDEGHPYATFLLGELHYKRRDYEEALRLFERARKRDPAHGDTLVRLGELYLRREMFEDARRVLSDFLDGWEEEAPPPKRVVALALLADSRKLKG